ncbi:hypothetical protein SEPCBS119000_002613 [Sporothrix epigloea]|uniref:U4/U6.U5 small nuclear ribonucleoprotein 27kDa protein domain-containing protein n=1 Tax=Sporothrix epigloea TaxID=1892477 RepID=A0ABP0DH30_9PEZI
MADYRRNHRPVANSDRERGGSDGSSHRTRDRDSGRDRERGDRSERYDRDDHHDRSRRHRSRYDEKDADQDNRDRNRTRDKDRDRDRDRDRARDREVGSNRRDRNREHSRERDRKRRERDYDRAASDRADGRRRSASPLRRSGSPAFVPPAHSHVSGPYKNLRRPSEQDNKDGDLDGNEEEDEMGLLQNGRHAGLPNRARARRLAGSDGGPATPANAVAPMSFRVGRPDRRDDDGGGDGDGKPLDARQDGGYHGRDSGETDYDDGRYTDYNSQAKEEEDDVEVDDDGMDAMQAMMGFGSFASTKGTKVAGNNAGAVRKVKRTQYRQYMNRQGGFNRPLSPSR